MKRHPLPVQVDCSGEDAVYLRLTTRPIERTCEFFAGNCELAVDFDEDENVVGIELIEGASVEMNGVALTSNTKGEST